MVHPPRCSGVSLFITGAISALTPRLTRSSNAEVSGLSSIRSISVASDLQSEG